MSGNEIGDYIFKIIILLLYWVQRDIYEGSYIVEFTPPSFSFTPPPPFLE
jgi:hypothetical protein